LGDLRPNPVYLFINVAFALAGSFALGAFWFASLTRKLFYPL
jgi:hypothetical protein